jgi:hypothetical protein
LCSVVVTQHSALNQWFVFISYYSDSRRSVDRKANASATWQRLHCRSYMEIQVEGESLMMIHPGELRGSTCYRLLSICCATRACCYVVAFTDTFLSNTDADADADADTDTDTDISVARRRRPTLEPRAASRDSTVLFFSGYWMQIHRTISSSDICLQTVQWCERTDPHYTRLV